MPKQTIHTRPKPLVLIILDGWGYRAEIKANAIASAHTPHWDNLLQHYPHTFIAGSGRCVGLPDGQMGNSEVGHLNMGAGRIVPQDFTRISMSLEDGSFLKNETLMQALSDAKENHKNVHVLGLLSPGGVHSHERHIHALIELAAKQQVTGLFIHAFLDGRDTPPQSALASIKTLESVCNQFACGRIASLVGRYYAMDRDKRWDRVKKAYHLLTLGEAEYTAANAQEALLQAYKRNENDEFVKPIAIHEPSKKPITIEDGDVIIFMNYRADRVREIVEALINPDFTGFERKKWPKLKALVSLTQYDKRFNTPIVFPPQSLNNILAAYLAEHHLKQLRIAETEKYAHVTFFFNGGVEAPFPLEDRILIPSPKVATYDLQPEMSAPELTARLNQEIESGQYDVIICNFANPDMVGHTGNFNAAVKAIETIDASLQKISQTILGQGGELLITADHGNAEQMYNFETNQPHTAHTNNPVPFVYIGQPAIISKEDGKLSDIAPTLLYLLGLEKPSEMTGHSLVKLV